MTKRFVHSDQFSKVFSTYDLVKKTATLKASEEFNGNSIFYVCDASYGNWIYAQGHLYGSTDNDSSINDLYQIIEEDELVYAGLFNDIYDKLGNSSLIPGDHIDISNGVISATYPVASTSINGLMSSADKTKLDGLVNYVLPIASSSELGGIKVGNGLSIDNTTGILSTSIFIPTKTSEIINDSSFVSSEYVSTVSNVSIYAIAATPIVDKTQDSVNQFAIDPNKMYMFGTRTSLTITLNPGNSDIVNEYMFQFTSESVATTLNVPSSVTWLKEPDIQTGKKYAVSIENNLGIIGEWNNE